MLWISLVLIIIYDVSPFCVSLFSDYLLCVVGLSSILMVFFTHQNTIQFWQFFCTIWNGCVIEGEWNTDEHGSRRQVVTGRCDHPVRQRQRWSAVVSLSSSWNRLTLRQHGQCRLRAHHRLTTVSRRGLLPLRQVASLQKIGGQFLPKRCKTVEKFSSRRYFSFKKC